ncbi:monofunctional biosynthetic peptidoglycan transglycosylase [Microbulbifer sediminum]|uniref:monofunctional biosynthetic peptidoglycan transglycosylase n=1 Tax=Microbulbifer sediminum TaxID=2904250 RepID=UPI001F0245D6|nr:monofunctional biosynthetic peptidoglycan transglycosylase [Microbulbifer sediminum]
MTRHLQRTAKYTFWIGSGFVAVTVLMVLALRWINPASSAVISAWERESGRVAAHQWRSLEQISPNLQMAVIAAEDQKFPHHFGFDFASMMKALKEDRGRIRGASTITQQTAKNLFLWNGRSYVRKALEAWFTLLMEILWPKERILEVYLNIAEFGEGVYGAQAAAMNFFGASARNINRWQAGRLAAVLPSPKRMSARNPSSYVRNRAYTIDRQVRQLGGTGYLGQL